MYERNPVEPDDIKILTITCLIIIIIFTLSSTVLFFVNENGDLDKDSNGVVGPKPSNVSIGGFVLGVISWLTCVILLIGSLYNPNVSMSDIFIYTLVLIFISIALILWVFYYNTDVSYKNNTSEKDDIDNTVFMVNIFFIGLSFITTFIRSLFLA
jgi:hypothetical protein